MRDPKFDILFQPLRIGPLTAKNRFYQVPQCAGMGDHWIHGQARHREIKAEGGWAVVSTEFCENHRSSDQGYPAMRLWDDGDIKPMAKVAEGIHRHGALAATQIGHLGHVRANLYTREPPLAPSPLPIRQMYPTQARAMDKRDIRELLDAQRKAARRARAAGFDIIYCDAGGVDGPPLAFVLPAFNRRTDEYGGSMQNRLRFFREYLEATREGAGPDRALAVRLTVDELLGAEGMTVEDHGLAVIEALGELPDLWDINVGDWENDSLVSRFGKEGSQERFAAFIKAHTSKPVVGVGRYTSPDAMVSVLRRGVQDFIGAARPSIADPFLPRKVEEGRLEDIRECIGCNICVSGFLTYSPARCTQNPTMGDEWKRDWHPERIAAKGSDSGVLVVGGGPAGLECAHALGKRGYTVTLAEARKELGGRVALESRLPGFAEWLRVREYRTQQFLKLPNVTIYPDNRMQATDILEFGADHVVLAAGSTWRRDGYGRSNPVAIPGWDGREVLTPDDIFAEPAGIAGPVVVFDDDHYYLGNAVAEKLRRTGHDVTIVTPAAELATFSIYTQEHRRTMERMHELGIVVRTHRNLARIGPESVRIAHVHTRAAEELPCRTLVMVTFRDSVDSLYHELTREESRLKDAGIKSVERVGDCLVPGTIAAAVWSGHRYARELDVPSADVPFRRERTELYSEQES